MSEPSPYVKLLLGNEVQKTVSKPKSTDPKWEDNFHFLVSDPRNQDLIIEVSLKLGPHDLILCQNYIMSSSKVGQYANFFQTRV